ncbi:adenylate kinase 5, like isoform X2 [Xiphias gladius]|uniref:adenylate kinase 5, like isoform X2 n=1 Tax=Xiphias gladius TaxID=8245 RepID=UPI001A99F49C|nr:adenylate kinase 5, like isoform X2 [Xiphias gladius]
MSSKEVKEYLSDHLVPQLLESLLTGLLYHRPEDPISFLQSCLIRTRQLGGPQVITWETFIHLDRDKLRPEPSKTHPGPARTTSVPTITPITPSGTPQTATASRVLLPAPPGPTGTPPVPFPVHAEVKEEDTKTVSSEVRSQLSIDSDSDMTESSGLLQEVSILPPQRPRPLIFFIIGGPGSGKGSQTARLAHCFGLRVVSLDNLLRKQLLSHASPSRKWEVVSEMMNHGELGPQEETISELRRQLIGQQHIRGFIVDGFPRDVHQALSFQEQMGSPDLVILLLCSNETLNCRLQQRAARLGLLGDSNHTFRRRLDTFRRDIVSIRRYYRQTYLLTQVDADRDEDEVFADLSSVIREKLQLKDRSDPVGIPECSSVVPDVPFNIRSVNQ